MKLSIAPAQLIHYLAKQMAIFYPDGGDVLAGLQHIMPNVLERMQYCFSHIHKKYYVEHEHVLFNHLNGDHYAMLLYWIANEAWRQGLILIAEKAFLLNKALHGIDAFYSIQLPDIFLFVHPTGTVLGNALYANFLVIYQNVTIGSDLCGVYPRFGEGNVLYAKSTVIGQCTIGSNVSIAAHTFIRNMDVLDNVIVVGLHPENKIKENKNNNIQCFFK